MPLIDAQGRLFGRWNLVDTAAVLVIGLVIPLAYGAYVLFRPPAARLIAVDPARIIVGTTQVTVKGEHLRPTFRMTLGTTGTTFLYANPDGGVLKVPPFPPGSYDLVLLDEDLEIDRLRGALIIEEKVVKAEKIVEPEKEKAPDGVLLAVGAFTALDRRQVRMLSGDLQRAMKRPAQWGEVLSFLPAEPNVSMLDPIAIPVRDGRSRIRAVLKLPCVVGPKECRVNKVALVPGAKIPIRVNNETALFDVEDLHPDYTSRVEVTLRTYLAPEEVALLNVLLSAGQSPREATFPARGALLPKILSLSLLSQTQDQQQVANVRVRVPALETTAGWVYRSRVLLVGDSLVFVVGSQQLSGRILTVTPRGSATENAGQ